MSDEGRAALTEPAKDLGPVKEQLRTDGYAVVPDVLTADEVAALRSRLVQLAADEREAARALGAPESDEAQFVRTLVAKAQEFRDLAVHPTALELARHILGPDLLLWEAFANRVPPGGPAGGAHIDQGPMPSDITWPVVCAFLYMLDDFTDENGATFVVPGSHRRHRDELTPESFAAGRVTATGTAGSVIVMDGRVWHSIGKNRTSDFWRHGALMFYSVPYLRVKENWAFLTPPEIVQDASPLLRELMGFKMWRSLGGPRADKAFIGGQAGVSSYDGQLLKEDEASGWGAVRPPWLN
ncbi:phytanoyl-CoA dioxygenase family protein [Pseudonocardia sp.]|uniref:phytanoyl-CoA dioxygenase family protein n=1 Tax=Pseudonocardia sp. TaxID=60912 RepID=UPI003D14A7C5